MSSPALAFTPAADRRNALDRAHIGDIEGALGTIYAFDTGPRLSTRRRLGTLLAVLGPGIVVMVADNDAGTISVFAQAGQDQRMRLLWVILALCPALYITQEMVARLGAVTGSGHARLTLERFGKLWCGFSLADLGVLNLATLVTEFIGVAFALSYFGIDKYVSVPVAAALLIAVTGSGSFRCWERAMYAMIAADLSLIPLALLSRPHPAAVADGLIPTLGGGASSSALLVLLLALVGTTIAPAQLFFQQSNVVDKRITPRWLGYERADTAIGVILFAACAGAILILSAGALGGSPTHTHFTDAGAVTQGVAAHLGTAAGAVFAIALLNASLLGAAVVSLSVSYALAEVVGIKHSLHRNWRDAKAFHACFAAITALAAGIVLLPGLPLGTVTTLVQAFAGILLPSTLVLLIILCNDKSLLGPLTNGRWLNASAIAAVVAVLALSTLMTITVALPNLGSDEALLATGGLLLATALALAASHLRNRQSSPSEEEALTPWQRRTWSAPALELVKPASPTRPRLLALAILRCYILTIACLLALKLAGVLP
ncbi:MAG: NRAMP family divalent metal transporter [Solirubrobacteraceae bacterium]